MQMRELRCKTPELVRKEVWTHVLAYNLIRTVMAQAAATHGIEPRSISFTGAMQTLEAFQPLLEFGLLRIRHNACGCTTTCSMPSPRIGSPTAPIATSRGEKAEAQSLRLADQAPRRDQTQDGERGYRELSAIRRSARSAQRREPNLPRRVGPERAPWQRFVWSCRESPDPAGRRRVKRSVYLRPKGARGQQHADEAT